MVPNLFRERLGAVACQETSIEFKSFETHIHIVDSDAPLGGIGKPGVPPIAPALANAFLHITGTPVRSLPIRLTEQN